MNDFIFRVSIWLKEHCLEQNVKELGSQDFVQEWEHLMVVVSCSRDVERKEKRYQSNEMYLRKNIVN